MGRIQERASDVVIIGKRRWQVIFLQRTKVGTFRIVQTRTCNSKRAAHIARDRWERPWFDHMPGKAR